MGKRHELINWIKMHKKQLVIAGISIGALVLLVLGIKNKAAIKTLWNSLRGVVRHSENAIGEETLKAVAKSAMQPAHKTVEAVASNVEVIPIEVKMHIRNLPKGWHASSGKIAEASKYGISLLAGQTWVEAYVKGGVAA